ncbi:MAG: hypothetical protein ACYC4D_04545 [Thermoleophilia bacterium]
MRKWLESRRLDEGWARGEIRVGPARAIAVAAHAAARDDDAATATEHDWQYRRLPEHLRSLVFPAGSDS